MRKNQFGKLIKGACLCFGLILLASCQQNSGSNVDQNTLTQSSEWQTLETTGHVHPRHEAAFVEFKGEFYSLGGRRIQPVDIYNPQTQQWRQGSAPPVEIHHFQPVVYKDAIILAGAMTGRYPNETPIDKLLYYYPEQDKWTFKANLPKNRLRGGAGSVIYQDKLYLVAGIQNGHVGGFVPWLDVYDFKTKQWTKLADAPHARDHFQAAILDGKIYAVGGRTTSSATNQVFDLVVKAADVFNIKTQTWQTLKQGIPTPRAGTSTLVVKDEVWVLGGETNRPPPAHNEVEILNPSNQTWRSFTPLNRGRHGTGAILYQDKVWTCCGSGSRGGSPELTSIESIKLAK